MGKVTLNTIPCSVCKELIKGISVQEKPITEVERVHILILANCKSVHSTILFAEKIFTITDVEDAAATLEDEGDSAVDDTQKWMDSF